jgi:endogenous inhibitor of DNA gyrase (YacG/DUF329 family)
MSDMSFSRRQKAYFDDVYGTGLKGEAYADLAEEPIIWSDREAPCTICGEPTHWIEVNFEARSCSKRCTSIEWANFERANRESTGRSLSVALFNLYWGIFPSQEDEEF